VTVPVVGQVTDTVAKSPTDDANGEYELHKTLAVYEGLVALTADEVGVITTVPIVPKSGNKVTSTAAAAKSWLN
jgi:hypothetical protein